MDLLKGKEIMAWTFMGNTRMYQALRDYGDRISQIGLFSFKVNASGEIYESGVSIATGSTMRTYINKWPHIKWLLTVSNDGTNSIFAALRDNTDGAQDTFLTELVRIMEEYDFCDGIDIDLEKGDDYSTATASTAMFKNIYNAVKAYDSTKLGITDKEYTDAVDSGTYTAFSSDSAGYGLAQWTYSTRKKALLEYAVAQKASVGNLSMQLAFLYKEMSESYSTVLNTLKNATSVLQASNIVLTKYEKPADTGTSVQTKRAGYGQTYYDKYAGDCNPLTSSSTSSSSTSAGTSTVTEKTATDPAKSFNKSLAGTYKTTANLYMRNGAGQGKASMVVLPKGTSVKNYGYYTAVNGVKWLYVQVTYNNIKYTGFCCGTYLKKQ